MKKTKLLISLTILASQFAFSQTNDVTLFGNLVDAQSTEALPFANVLVLSAKDSSFVSGTISEETGAFKFQDITAGEYILKVNSLGYTDYLKPFFIGASAQYINLGKLELNASGISLDAVVIAAKQEAISEKLDKKVFTLDANVSQIGGSVLQSIASLPGVTTQDGQLQIRGSSQIVVLIDGKQTALAGFGNQKGLANLPASAVEKIEIINNPSAKYDANGQAGIVNIVLKKNDKMGFNGKIGATAGVGALWVRKDNLPDIRPQYVRTPKINPNIALNYRKKKINLFLQADNLYTQTLNANSFTTRYYDDGTVIQQQMKRNRNTNFFTSTVGLDWVINNKNSLTVSGLFSQESIKDKGDQPFYNGDFSARSRLWQFLEDEVVTAAMGSANFVHKFNNPGEKLTVKANYTFDRENEKYFFDNFTPDYLSQDSFKLIADQKVTDLMLDYSKPTKHGLFETGLKYRNRTIPTNMKFYPGYLSQLDTNADGKATYIENIPAAYADYTYEVKKFVLEAGLRLEYVKLSYLVDPTHNTYKSDGYQYFQPFPNARVTYRFNETNNITAFYNRRVTRPDEGNIRIFPKYDDAEIVKVGNPSLKPQYTNTAEIGYKKSLDKSYFYAAAYFKASSGTITRIATKNDTSNLIYNVSQNAGNSYNTGAEAVYSHKTNSQISFDVNANVYYNQIDSFTVINYYPTEQVFHADQQSVISGNAKLNINVKTKNGFEATLSAIYLAPDIIPQGKINQRFTMNAGVQKSIQKGRGTILFNATDLLNTLVTKTTVYSTGFRYVSANYGETQVFRLGYNYKF
jgi:outer membrane receptor protein involved in Fe transport